MIQFIKAWWAKHNAPEPKYRIVYDPELGYCPQYYDGDVFGWSLIDPSGVISQSHDALRGSLWHSSWCKTEKDAGERINRHSAAHGQRVVWKG